VWHIPRVPIPCRKHAQFGRPYGDCRAHTETAERGPKTDEKFFLNFRRTVFPKQCRGLPPLVCRHILLVPDYCSPSTERFGLLPSPRPGASKMGEKSLNYGSSIFDPSSRANASSGSARFARVEAVSRRLPIAGKNIPPDLPNFQPACPKLREKCINRVQKKPPSSKTAR
jgi:hypothetical protein